MIHELGYVSYPIVFALCNRFEMDEQHSDALEELETEKDIHNIFDSEATAKKVENSAMDNKNDKDEDSKKAEKPAPAPISPEASALMVEKETVNRELKLKIAEFDEEIRKRKNAQDTLIREAKASIDKEIDALKEDARKAAAELASAIDVKLGAFLNAETTMDSEL
jgi:hypothetical protein